jgi:hypothetical protein
VPTWEDGDPASPYSKMTSPSNTARRPAQPNKSRERSSILDSHKPGTYSYFFLPLLFSIFFFFLIHSPPSISPWHTLIEAVLSKFILFIKNMLLNGAKSRSLKQLFKIQFAQNIRSDFKISFFILHSYRDGQPLLLTHPSFSHLVSCVYL